jgi:hypothetical protein
MNLERQQSTAAAIDAWLEEGDRDKPMDQWSFFGRSRRRKITAVAEDHGDGDRWLTVYQSFWTYLCWSCPWLMHYTNPSGRVCARAVLDWRMQYTNFLEFPSLCVIELQRNFIDWCLFPYTQCSSGISLIDVCFLIRSVFPSVCVCVLYSSSGNFLDWCRFPYRCVFDGGMIWWAILRWLTARMVRMFDVKVQTIPNCNLIVKIYMIKSWVIVSD